MWVTVFQKTQMASKLYLAFAYFYPDDATDLSLQAKPIKSSEPAWKAVYKKVIRNNLPDFGDLSRTENSESSV